jgi:hypothetical protein
MTEERCWHPDLLRRFAPTPYVFGTRDSPYRSFVESNDLEIALSVSRSHVFRRQNNWAGEMLCKLIRDMSAPVDGSEITLISDGPLRVLFLGRGTILIHDHQRSELLGFIARDIRVQELVSSLIPLLLDGLAQQ